MILGLHINQSKYHLGRWFSPRNLGAMKPGSKFAKFAVLSRQKVFKDHWGYMYMFIYTHAFTYIIFTCLYVIYIYIYIYRFIHFLHPCIYIYLLYIIS